jgi:hypothetical protein
VIAVALGPRITLARHPFAKLSTPVAVALAGLAAYAAWILLSVVWSHAPDGRSWTSTARCSHGLCLLFAATLASDRRGWA